ncbi:MAG: metal ABC transporter substrate-binding protein [Saprospiraceae bacterium]
MEKKTKIKITLEFLDIEEDVQNIENEAANSTSMLINRTDANNFMKKIIFSLIISCLTLPGFAQEKKTVVATASMLADMAKNIAGGMVKVECIVPIGGDPHLHEPTPRDAKMVNRADLILKNGLTFEGWLNELIENSGTKAKTVRVTEGIQPIKSVEYENSADPHAWMDANLGLVYIKNIKDALSELDPDNAVIYAFNYGVYKKQLEDLDQYIKTAIQKIPAQKRVLITSHDAFQYYGRAYGVRLEAILGTSTDAEAQTSDIIRLNKVIKTSNVPALFVESTINPKLLKQLAKDNDIEIGGQLYADSIGDKESPAPTYIDMLKHNTDVIVTALSRKSNPEKTSTSKDESGSNWLLWGIIAALLIGGFILMIRMQD